MSYFFHNGHNRTNGLKSNRIADSTRWHNVILYSVIVVSKPVIEIIRRDRRANNNKTLQPSAETLKEWLSKRANLYHAWITNIRGHPIMTSTRRGRGQAQVDGEGSSPMWTSAQKINIRDHWRHPAFFSCKEIGVFYQNFVFGRNKKWKFFGNIN